MTISNAFPEEEEHPQTRLRYLLVGTLFRFNGIYALFNDDFLPFYSMHMNSCGIVIEPSLDNYHATWNKIMTLNGRVGYVISDAIVISL